MESDSTELESLRKENEALRKRVAELERAARPEGIPYAQIFESLPVSLHVRGADGFAIKGNRLHHQAVGMEAAEKTGVRHNILEDEQAVAGGFAAAFERAVKGEVVKLPPAFYDLSKFGLPGAKALHFWLESIFFPVDDAAGNRYVVEMLRDVTTQQQHDEMLRAIIDNAPMYIYAKDLESHYLLANHRTTAVCGLSADEMLGKTDFEIFPPEVADALTAADREVTETGETKLIEEEVMTAQGLVVTSAVKFPLRDARGTIYGICGIGADITERRLAEDENRRLQDEMLHVKEAALRALSTPLIPIAAGVLAMPLIGDIDPSRAHHMLETLLHGVANKRASVAILDATGVTSAGPEVADALVQAAKAVGLLGAKVILTGIQPALAQSLASLEVKLSGVVTRSTLEDGIAFAMRMRR